MRLFYYNTLKLLETYVTRIVDVIAVHLGNPARIPDVDSREIWIPRWSSDGFSKGRDQIVFRRESGG